MKESFTFCLFFFSKRPECVALRGCSACGERTTLAPSSPPKLNQMCNEAGSSSNYFHLSRDRLHVNANACSPITQTSPVLQKPCGPFPTRLSFPCHILPLSCASITRQSSQFCHSHRLVFVFGFFFFFIPAPFLCFILH